MAAQITRTSQTVVGFVLAAALAVTTITAFERTADAQALPLPRLDNINIFVETGKFYPAADLVTDERGFLYGWGFETSFEVGPVGRQKNWLLELAVGYEQISGIVSKNGNYRVDGSLRDLPSIAAYITNEDTGVYFGVKSGLVGLRDFHAYTITDGTQYGMSGDTIMLGGAVGYMFDFGLALELAYQVRWFPGVSYSLPEGATMLPADLPRTLGMHGVTLSIAYQIAIGHRPPPPPSPMAASPRLGATPTKLVTGPARISSYGFATTGGGHAELYLVDDKADCSATPETILGWIPGVQGEIVVPADKIVCARADTEGIFSWTGFGP